MDCALWSPSFRKVLLVLTAMFHGRGHHAAIHRHDEPAAIPAAAAPFGINARTGLPYVRKPYNKSIARVIEQAVGGPAVPAAMSASEREELVPRPRMVHPQQGRGSF